MPKKNWNSWYSDANNPNIVSSKDLAHLFYFFIFFETFQAFSCSVRSTAVSQLPRIGTRARAISHRIVQPGQHSRIVLFRTRRHLLKVLKVISQQVFSAIFVRLLPCPPPPALSLHRFSLAKIEEKIARKMSPGVSEGGGGGHVTG